MDLLGWIAQRAWRERRWEYVFGGARDDRLQLRINLMVELRRRYIGGSKPWSFAIAEMDSGYCLDATPYIPTGSVRVLDRECRWFLIGTVRRN